MTIELDKPLKNIEKDKLNISYPAKNIADAIIDRIPDEGFVIGIYGSWGSGKTTFINFIKYYLSKHKEKKQPIIIDCLSKHDEETKHKEKSNPL